MIAMKSCFDVVMENGGIIEKESGGWSKTLCPRHGDRTPSLRIAPDGSYWRCMVCGDDGGKGDAISLYRWFTPSATFYQAVSAVEGDANHDPFLSTLTRLMTPHEQDDTDFGPYLLARCMRDRLLTLEQIDDALASEDTTTTLIIMLDSKRRMCYTTNADAEV
jgi:hypothetical protein